MITNFNEQLWIDFDLEVAVILENFAAWIRFNATKRNPKDRNLHEGRYWTYDSYCEYSKRFSGWSPQTIRRIIKRAVDAELLMKGNFNSKKYDNTNWYSLTDKGLEYFPALRDLTLNTPVETDIPPVEIDRPIPKDLNSLSSNNTITTNSVSKSKSKEKNLNILREMIDAYRESFPNNPQPHPKLIATSLQKTLQTLIKRWPEADPEGKPFDIVGFKRYLHGLKTLAPKFSLGEYETKDGNKKKNGMETFCRWNTFVKFLEDQYS